MRGVERAFSRVEIVHERYARQFVVMVSHRAHGGVPLVGGKVRREGFPRVDKAARARRRRRRTRREGDLCRS